MSLVGNLPMFARARTFDGARGLSLAVALALAFSGLLVRPDVGVAQETLEIATKSGVHVFAVELARNDEERAKGLMFRRQLPEGRGMLFDFEREGPVAMWMRNTFIPLDMIFIKSDGRILRIAENTVPKSERIIPSGGPVLAVLEVIGGTARKLGIAPGDQVAHPIFNKPR